MLHLTINFIAALLALSASGVAMAQRVQFPPNTGLRTIDGQVPTTNAPAMVPINPNRQAGVLPQAGYGGPAFDPYATNQNPGPLLGGPIISGPAVNAQIIPPGNPISGPGGVGYPYPQTNSGLLAPSLPGTGQSGIVNTFPNNPTNYGQPGLYPNSAPSALFPGPQPASGSGSLFGGFFRNMYNGLFGNSPSGYALPPLVTPTQPLGGGIYPPGYNWNPQGTIFNPGQASMPGFIRLFQGPRFRHAYVHGNEDADGLMINDSDASVAFAIPNFFMSNQPLYLLPSFSLHQWDGPHPAATADLPALAYSAFLDSGWQSDPARILGAELGLRVGMFSDFDTATSDSLRIMGRGIGRVRLTPRATLKAGVIYLDRNKVKLLPAGGILWQPNENTRLDLFFPEPKLASYLTTVGNTDTWWYAGGYYGGGAWTVKRADNTTDSIDINDLRLVLGLEFGQNAQMREGRRNAFVEFGFVFDRELLYDSTPADNLGLQDTVMVRAGFGY